MTQTNKHVHSTDKRCSHASWRTHPLAHTCCQTPTTPFIAKIHKKLHFAPSSVKQASYLLLDKGLITVLHTLLAPRLSVAAFEVVITPAKDNDDDGDVQ